MSAASLLIAASAAIVTTLGSLHLLYTFQGPKLRPRDPQVVARMQADTMGITRDTSVWNAWIGFNASHSLGVMLFGLVYGYLALCAPQFLFGSVFLAVLGGAFLLSFVWLAWRYWFRVPLAGVALATLLYVAGFAASRF